MTTFSDNFDGGSGNLDARANWDETMLPTNNSNTSATVTLASDVVARTGNGGVLTYTICTGITPGAADYIASVDAKITAEGTFGRYLYTPAVRCVKGATGMTGYVIQVDPGPSNFFALVRKWLNGTVSSVGTAFAISDYDWTTSHTLKIDISGSASTVIKLYIDGSLVNSRTDSSSPITAAGQTALFTYFNGSGHDPDNFYDNFFVDDGIASGIVIPVAMHNYRRQRAV